MVSMISTTPTRAAPATASRAGRESGQGSVSAWSCVPRGRRHDLEHHVEEAVAPQREVQRQVAGVITTSLIDQRPAQLDRPVQAVERASAQV
ncbi:MAG: hypothetical protein IPN77_15000 [Sandaracinaceae bacterium]|nr:hypothetical protein [Sandaracinaceae bacterium]